MKYISTKAIIKYLIYNTYLIHEKCSLYSAKGIIKYLKEHYQFFVICDIEHMADIS